MRRSGKRRKVELDRTWQDGAGEEEWRGLGAGMFCAGSGNGIAAIKSTTGRSLNVARGNGVRFDFPDEHQAALAFSLLQELGYEPERNGRGVNIRLDGNDLVSAIEIASAHGGELAGAAGTNAEESLTSAYGIDEIPIPAHTVDPDWPDA